MQLFMGHIVPCLHFIERDNIFSSCVSSTQFFLKTWFVSFYLSPPLLFFPKTVFPKSCFVFPMFMGGEIFLTFVVLRGSCCSSQGELSLFSLTLLRMFSIYLLIGQSLSIRDKKGETQITCLFCLGGEYKNFLIYLTQGESQNLLLFFIFRFIILFICLSFHTCGDVFVECFRKDRCILIKTFYLFLQLLGQESQIGICDVIGHFIVLGCSCI